MDSLDIFVHMTSRKVCMSCVRDQTQQDKQGVQ